MKLLDYIKGLRKGKEAHRIEREAMEDSFLSDALEGFDNVGRINHIERIERLQKQILHKSRSANIKLWTWSVAASILVCISIGGYLALRSGSEIDSLYEERELTAIEESTHAISDEPERVVKQSSDVIAEARTNKEVQIVQKQTEPVMGMEIEDDVKVAEVSPAEFSSALKIKNSRDISADSITSEPVIGMDAYREYLKENRIIQTDKECADKKGAVVLIFSVAADGKPINIQVKTSVCPGIDAEAIRLLTEGCLWTVSQDTVELKVE